MASDRSQRRRVLILAFTAFTMAFAVWMMFGLPIREELGLSKEELTWLLVALLVQVALGFWVALFYRWGADWYLYTAVPWLMSLAKLDPQIQHVVALPWVVKLHFLGGFLIIALFPFTRLVHLVTFPFWYLWRPYQVVIWNRRPQHP